MKSIRRSALCVIFFMSAAAPVFCQGFYFADAPKLVIGGDAGIFRINYDPFGDAFGSKWASSPGLHGSLRIKTPYNLVVKYKQFEKTGVQTIDNVSVPISWDQNWINIGVRHLRWADEGGASFFSFGISLFNIEEMGSLGILPQRNDIKDGKTDTGGFFLDFGVHYPLFNYLALTAEMELTSASIGGGASFQGSSIGGLNVSVGLSLLPF